MSVTPTVVPLNHLEVKNAICTLEIENVVYDFADHLDSVKLNFSSSPSDFKAISGRKRGRAKTPEETVEFNLAQDLTPGSLWRVLRENHGKDAKFTFLPAGGAEPGFSGECQLITPDTVGGAEGSNTATASLPVYGSSTIVDPVAAPQG